MYMIGACSAHVRTKRVVWLFRVVLIILVVCMQVGVMCILMRGTSLEDGKTCISWWEAEREGLEGEGCHTQLIKGWGHSLGVGWTCLTCLVCMPSVRVMNFLLFDDCAFSKFSVKN